MNNKKTSLPQNRYVFLEAVRSPYQWYVTILSAVRDGKETAYTHTKGIQLLEGTEGTCKVSWIKAKIQ